MSRRRQRGSMRATLLDDLRGDEERYGMIDLEALARDADRRGDTVYAAYVRACARKAIVRMRGACVDWSNPDITGPTIESQFEVPQSAGAHAVRSAQQR